jgi:hypothetical protein
MTEHDVTPEQLCEAVRTTRKELAETLGLGKSALSKRPVELSSRSRSRLREFNQILRRLEPLAGSPEIAYSYYRAQPIPELGGRTAEALVKDGEASRVRDFLDHLGRGGFA